MRSFINPEVINKNKGASPEAFSTFMLGRKGTIGTSVLNTAKNKIVNFDRTAVKPISSNAPGVISSISTNVTNNTNTNVNNANSFSNLAQKLSQNVNTTLSTFINNTKNQTQSIIRTVQTQFKNSVDALTDNIKRDYQQKVQSIENTRPFSVLKKFLDLYKNAVSFITYFGDEKNFKRIRVALKTLRRIFDESFNIATLVRQVIVKIVRQLSNLPTASGNAPDLNLDLRVPGGPMRQQGQNSISNFGRNRLGRAIGFGAAAGVGLGAAQMVGSGISKAEQFQEEKLQESSVSGEKLQQTVPEDFLNSMERIINTFSKSIEDLIKFVTERSKQQPTSSPGSGASPQSPPPDAGTQGSAEPIDIASFSEQDKMMMGKMIAAEVGVDSTPEDAATVQNVLLNRYRTIKQGLVEPSEWGITGKTKEEVTLSDVLSVRSQWQPLRDGAFYRITEEQGRRALNKATLAGGTDPNKILQLGLSRGMSENDARILAESVAFFSGGPKPFSSQPDVRLPGGNAHRFMRSSRTAGRLTVYESQAFPYNIQQPGVTGIQTGGQTPSTRPSQVNPQGPQSSRVTGQPSSTTVASASQQSGVPMATVKPGVVVVPLNIGIPPSPPQATQVASSSQPIGNEGASNEIGGASLSSSDPTSPGWPWARAHLNITLV